MQVIGWIRDLESATGNAYLERGYQHDSENPMKLLEVLSAVSRACAGPDPDDGADAGAIPAVAGHDRGADGGADGVRVAGG